MSASLWFFLEALSNIMDQFLFLFLIAYQLPEERPNRVRDVFVLVLFSGLLTGMQQMELPFIVRFSAMFLVHLSYCFFFRSGTVLQRVLWPVIARITFYCLSQATTAFLSIIPGFNFQAMMGQTPQRFLGLCFYMFLSIIVFFLLSRTSPRKRRLPLRTQLISIVMATICIIFAGIIFDLSPAAMEQESTAWLLNITSAGFMISSIAWLFILDALATRNAELLDLQIEHQRTESERRYTEAVQSLYERMRVLRHDYANQMLALAGLADSNDIAGIKEHLAQLQADIPSNLLTVTKQPQLDAIIGIKLQQAAALQISTEVLFIMPDTPPIDIVDLCSIFGNILDNAIEAAQQVPIEHRYLRLDAGLASSMWQIKLKNSCNGKYRREDDQFLTTKQGAWHGIGLKHVRQLVEKNGGFIVLNPGAETFSVDILLPWAKQDRERA